MRGRGRRNGGGDRPAVESVRPLLGNQRQRLGQIGLNQPVAGPMRLPVRPQEDPRRLGILRQALGSGGDNRGVGLAEHKAVAGQRNCRRHYRGAAEPAVFGDGAVETHHRAGHPGGEIAV